MAEAPEVGPTLREHRKTRGMTLEQLAAASGVSRSMLSQVERGEANPTFATLWSLTHALGMTIDDLIIGRDAEAAPPIDVIGRTDTPRLGSDAAGTVLWLLAPPEQVGAVEWYELCLSPGASLPSQPHVAGTNEHVTVLDGAITVTAGSHTEAVEDGGTARYPADVTHEIANPHDEPARVLLVVLGSETG